MQKQTFFLNWQKTYTHWKHWQMEETLTNGSWCSLQMFGSALFNSLTSTCLFEILLDSPFWGCWLHRGSTSMVVALLLFSFWNLLVGRSMFQFWFCSPFELFGWYILTLVSYLVPFQFFYGTTAPIANVALSVIDACIMLWISFQKLHGITSFSRKHSVAGMYGSTSHLLCQIISWINSYTWEKTDFLLSGGGSHLILV